MSRGVTCACGATGQRGAACSVCALPLLRVKVPKRMDRTRPKRSKGTALLALLAVAATAGVGALVFAARQRTAPERERRAKVRAELAGVLPDLRRFVEENRGLPFLRDVESDLVDGEEFVRRYAIAGLPANPLVPVRRERPRQADRGATFAALGAVADAEEFDAAQREYDESLAGFYDPATESLVIRGSRIDLEARYVLVHELAHALQDQHFDLAAARELPDADARAAWDALVEGDATEVAEAFRRSLPPADQARIGGVGPGASGRTVEALRSFPYVAGAEFVRALRTARGREAVDAAYRRPPSSTRQVLHVESYLAETEPREVPRPEPEGEVLDRGVLGELGLLLALSGDRAAAAGWAGDAYVTYRAGARTCLRARIVLDSERDRDELVRAARGRTGWTAAAGGPRAMTLTACR